MSPPCSNLVAFCCPNAHPLSNTSTHRICPLHRRRHRRPHARACTQVVFACHADTALQLLGASASDAEKDALGAFAFARNTTYVHSDAALMPRRRAAWSAWNYMGDSADAAARGGGGAKPVYVTYWLNKLQNLDCRDSVFVSLNPSAPPDPAKTHRVIETTHPQFTPEGERAQRKVAALNGRRGLWFCGAWMGYGFHEDGLRSGLEVSSAITGKPVPWATGKQLVVPQPCLPRAETLGSSGTGWAYRAITAIAFRSIRAFLSRTIRVGRLVITCPDGQQLVFGEVLPRKSKVIHLRVFDWWFFVRVALEYDLGLARAYMAGEWAVADDTRYADGLRALFLLFVDNRDAEGGAALSVSRLLTSWGGYMLNFVRYRLSMDNSLSGSRSNIHAHYDLSNDLFTTFLDAETLMYSSAIYDAALAPVPAARRELARPPPAADAAGAAARMEAVVAAAAAAGAAPEEYELVFRGTLEEAQIRKIDTLLARARVQRHHTLLDIGFGWGGVAIRAAQTIGCRVWGITLSTEQKALAEARVRERGLEHLITFELVDYRVFARQHRGEFDRIISCEMIEAVGHNYLPSYFAAVEALLAPGGVFVMEAITTPESRYKEYLRSTDFINTIIFPGSCCPSLTALMDAMASHSRLSLEGYENIGVHYAETLREWRCRFTDALPALRARGFDAVFARCWHYYFAYCEAGFASQTEGCLILTFSRPGNAALLVDAETHRVLAKNATNADAAAAAAAARRGSVGGARRSSSVGL
ncbi:Mycolic acid cyclopropane synthetase-domain-containing protein [Tribonema minus]|uniref:Mycolic acid cyclopropane synthetase-domain-containing protein n=1 Tax=Tribonema minus TaxID=303371 RepID=A0A835ZDJ8_9STRA|nr:Mycolic acid cyclopropane synthetase-domain-containing protein [Tribonema minus]